MIIRYHQPHPYGSTVNNPPARCPRRWHDTTASV